MKIKNYLLLGAAGMLLASCSQQETVSVAEGDGNFSVTVKLPDTYSTRAEGMTYGNGYVATTLNFAVYDASTGNLVLTDKTSFSEDDLSATVNFNLAKNKSYNVMFFAQSPASDNVYEFNAAPKAEDATVTVAYENMDSQLNLQDAYDCFYNILANVKIGLTTVTESVTLYRPVAQINWGTSDLTNGDYAASHDDAYGPMGKYIETNLTINNAYSTFSLLEGNVTGEAGKVSIDGLAAPYQTIFPMIADDANLDPQNLPYIYVAMQYVLADNNEGELLDMNLEITNALNDNPNVEAVTSDIPLTSVPVQANYQTNIYGALLTDDLSVEVEKDPEWKQPDFNFSADEIADGLFYNLYTNTYQISNANGLEYYAENIANITTGTTALAGVTVVLMEDIDMTGVNHTPIWNQGATFDGNGHTISNLTVTAADKANAGFFAQGAGIIRNINFETVTITGNWNSGIVANGTNAQISGINVDGITVNSTPWSDGNSYDDGNNVGTIAGYLESQSGAPISITDCSVTNATVKGYRKVGGLTGYVVAGSGEVTISGNILTDVEVTADLATGYYGDYTTNLAGRITSNNDGEEYLEGNTLDNVTVSVIQPSQNQ